VFKFAFYHKQHNLSSFVIGISILYQLSPVDNVQNDELVLSNNIVNCVIETKNTTFREIAKTNICRNVSKCSIYENFNNSLSKSCILVLIVKGRIFCMKKKFVVILLAFWYILLVSCGGTDTTANIKGNINASGEKIYHMPGQQFYEVTKPEEMFVTEADAKAAGFRKSKR